MIDLHIHTNHSDGSLSVKDILIEAQNKNLDYISITDHDTCSAYEELQNIQVNQYYTGQIIRGIEIKCTYQSHLIEILGYNYNLEQMKNWIEEYYKDKQRAIIQIKYFNLLYDKCKKLNLKMADKEQIIWNPNNDWASFTIYQEIKLYKENKEKLPHDLWEDFTTFSKKYCGNPNNEWYIDKTKDYPPLDEVIKIVKDCKGLVFLPHLFIYKWAEDKKQFIETLLNHHQIDGIECYYNSFTEEQTKDLIALCQKRELYMSGGSDFHGKSKPDIQLGVGKGNLKIENDIIMKWINSKE